MTQQRADNIRYRIYISDGGTKFYLRDWIASDQRDNLVFDGDTRSSMKFKKLATAVRYRERMEALGYHPHIESVR